MRFDRAGTIEGLVLYEGGEPLIGWRVSLIGGDSRVDRVQTDEDGRFRFSLVAPGTYNLVASNTGEPGTHPTRPESLATATAEVVANETLLDRAYELAAMVVALPPLAIRKTKELVRTAQSVTLKENLDQAALFQGVLQQLDDHREAIDAILEKRKPIFKGA